MDLISLDRAKIQLPDAPETDYPLIAALISACSGVIETYTNRRFYQTDYDELHTVVGPTCSLWVNNPPIIEVKAVRNGEMPALYVQCQDPLNVVQYATVAVTSSGVTCRKMQNGSLVTDSTFDYVTYPTFTELAAAINALGNGWVATLPAQFAQWQTSDLSTNQTGRSARNVSLPLTVFWGFLSSYKVNKPLGEVWTGGLYRGHQVFRIQYSGGYALGPPEEIQQACAELVQMTYLSKSRNPLMQSETLDKYSYTNAIPVNWFDLLSPSSRMALQQHKVHRMTVSGTPARE